MQAYGPFPWLTRWNRRAVVVFVILLLVFWLVHFGLGIYPVSFWNSSLMRLALGCACGVVLFLVWLTILISPGTPRCVNPARETLWRLTAAGFCVLLAGFAFWLGGGPRALGTAFGGKLDIGLRPIRDLQQSPAVIALATDSDYKQLRQDQWPESISQLGRPPGSILVRRSPVNTPWLILSYGRGGDADILVQDKNPHSPDTLQWADDVWLRSSNGGD
jgi:hypothetical protein